MADGNTFRDKLARGEPVFGAACGIGSIEAAEIAAQVGFDFVFLDAQHAPMNTDWMRHALRALDAMRCEAIARWSSPDPHWFGPLMDMGYRTVAAPMINSVEQAEALARACRYPPRGTRSMGAARASIRYGLDHHRDVNDDVLVIATIETIDAVRAIEDIAAVDGLDVGFIGAVDLALSIGARPGDPLPTEVEDHIQTVRKTFADAGKLAMIGAPTPDDARRRADEGFNIIMSPSDLRFLWRGFKEYIDGSRGN